MNTISSIFIKNSGKYGLGIVLAKFGGFITLPIYFKYLTIEDFGIISVFQAILVFLNPLYSLILCDSVARFYYEWKDEIKKKKISSIFLSSILFSIILSIIFYFFGKMFVIFFFDIQSYDYIIPLLITTAFFNNLSLIPIVILKANQEIKKYNVLVLLTFFINSTISLVLIIIFELGVLGYLYGTLISTLLLGFYYFFYMTKKFGIYLNFKLLNDSFKFSLPLLPAGIIENLSNSLDRILLTYIFDLKIVGIYDLANRIGTIIQAVNQSIKSAWVPLIFDETTSVNKIKTGPKVYAYLSVYYVSFMIFICMGIFLFSDLLYFLFDDQKFKEVLIYLPFIISLYFVQSVSTALSRGIDIAKKTSYSILIQIFGILILGVLILIFAESMSFSTFLFIFLVSNILKYSYAIYLSYKFYPRPLLFYNYLKLFVISSLIILLSILLKRNMFYQDLIINTMLFLPFIYFLLKINKVNFSNFFNLKK